MAKHRCSIAAARYFRLKRYQLSQVPVKPPMPTRTELGRLSIPDWQAQYRSQMARCHTCGKLASKCRRLRADKDAYLVCRKCWWGHGNLHDTGPSTARQCPPCFVF